MLAFLKRRWILLTCAGSLAGFTMVDVWHSSLASWAYRYGISNGCFLYESSDPYNFVDSAVPQKHSFWVLRSHPPALGELGYSHLPRSWLLVVVPLWYPLSGVLAWLVFREVRWWQKRPTKTNLRGTSSK